MSVLLISSDQSILDAHSSGCRRALDVAQAIGVMHVLLPGTDSYDLQNGPLMVHVRKTKDGQFQDSLKKDALALVETEGILSIWSQDVFERGMVAMQVAQQKDLPLYVNVDTDFLSPWYSLTGIFRSSHVKVPKINKSRLTCANTVLPQADGIRVMSERVKTSLLAKYNSSIVEPVVIPIAVHETVPPKVAFPCPPFPFTLLVAGRLDNARRVIDVLDALARLASRYPGLGLFIIGDGPEREPLEKHALKLGIRDRVVFLGDRRDTWGLMQSAQVFIQASAYEGYGRRILQAALARVPIITTDVGIVGEVFRGYEDVLSFPPGDPAALAVHIVGLMEDPQARQMLAMHAQRSAQKFFADAGDIPGKTRDFLAGAYTVS